MKYSINDYPPYRAGKHSVFTSSENGCTHCGKNTSQCMVRQFKIDGGVFTDGTTPRCDYLLLNDDRHTSYYIELKGSDLPKAIEQLEHTISMISPSIPDYKVFRRIVYRTGSHKNSGEQGRVVAEEARQQRADQSTKVGGEHLRP